MNYIVLGHHLYPIPDANGICLMNILNEIQKRGNDVKVISQVSEKYNEINDGNTIRFYHHQLLSWSSCRTAYERLRYITRRVITLFNYPRIDNSLVKKKYIALSKKIIDNDDIDVIICVCNPVESVEAAVRLKDLYPGKRLVIYNIDTISDVPFPKIERPIAKYLSKKAHQWEKRVFSKADVIVNLKCHEHHFSQVLYKDYYKKMLFQDVPMLVKPSSSNNKKVERKATKRLVYAGSFYRKMRNPTILLNLFDRIPGLDYELRIYTSKAYCDFIRSILNEVTNIKVNGYLKSEELNEVILDSDILISLGNKESSMFPSKIVSYVAFGMPIIHIFQDETDSVIPYLKPYSNKLLIDNRIDCETNRKKIADFLKEEHLNTSWVEVSSEYRESTPEYCAKQILEAIKYEKDEVHYKNK